LVDFKDLAKLRRDFAWSALPVTSFPDVACGSVELMDQSLGTIQDDHFSIYQLTLNVSASPRAEGLGKAMIGSLHSEAPLLAFCIYIHLGFRMLNDILFTANWYFSALKSPPVISISNGHFAVLMRLSQPRRSL
jgi:hypothetical protein